MPTYNVINKNTGDKQEFSMTMKAYDQWRKDNPDWDKDWQAGIAGTTYGKPKQSDGFKEVMSKIQSEHPRANPKLWGAQQAPPAKKKK